ncbi:MAG: ABC transporter permease [Halobacteriales archaeon]
MVSFLAGLLDATVKAGTVFVIAGLGEIIAERAGVLNLGMEGMLLVGALTGFMTTVVTGNPYFGFGVAVVAGIGMAAIHAFLCISLKSDQVISGVMLTLLGAGLTTYFGQGWTQHSIRGVQKYAIPVVGGYLREIPVIGPAVFYSTPTDYLAILLVPAVWYLLYRTNLGLELISVGEDPETADTMGVEVFKLRYLAVLTGGAFAGLAGAHLSLAYTQIWVAGMVAGRGWIAVALVIFARWRPSYALVGAYLFGLLEALQLRSQALTLTVEGAPAIVNQTITFLMHPQIMSTYPYFVTVAVLAVTVARSGEESSAVPAALLQSYSRETD